MQKNNFIRLYTPILLLLCFSSTTVFAQTSSLEIWKIDCKYLSQCLARYTKSNQQPNNKTRKLALKVISEENRYKEELSAYYFILAQYNYLEASSLKDIEGDISKSTLLYEQALEYISVCFYLQNSVERIINTKLIQKISEYNHQPSVAKLITTLQEDIIRALIEKYEKKIAVRKKLESVCQVKKDSLSQIIFSLNNKIADLKKEEERTLNFYPIKDIGQKPVLQSQPTIEKIVKMDMMNVEQMFLSDIPDIRFNPSQYVFVMPYSVLDSLTEAQTTTIFQLAFKQLAFWYSKNKSRDTDKSTVIVQVFVKNKKLEICAKIRAAIQDYVKATGRVYPDMHSIQIVFRGAEYTDTGDIKLSVSAQNYSNNSDMADINNRLERLKNESEYVSKSMRNNSKRASKLTHRMEIIKSTPSLKMISKELYNLIVAEQKRVKQLDNQVPLYRK
jgi:hypothetical protein